MKRRYVFSNPRKGRKTPRGHKPRKGRKTPRGHKPRKGRKTPSGHNTRKPRSKAPVVKATEEPEVAEELCTVEDLEFNEALQIFSEARAILGGPEGIYNPE